MFCKHILGVRKSTSINGILLELGRSPLYLSANKAAIKNWERIRSGEANFILSSSFSDSINLGLNWSEKIKSFMSGIGMLDCFLHDGVYSTPIYKKVFQRISDICHQDQLSSIANENSKLRTYNLIKTDIGFENYLT